METRGVRLGADVVVTFSPQPANASGGSNARFREEVAQDLTGRFPPVDKNTKDRPPHEWLRLLG